MKDPLDRAEALLRKAEHDLRTANLSVGDPELADTVCFHAQQAAEKGLKAILAAHDIVYPRTHDLGNLLQTVLPLVPGLGTISSDALSLSAYAVDVRYDTELVSPDQADALEAIQVATAVYDITRQAVADLAGAGQSGGGRQP